MNQQGHIQFSTNTHQIPFGEDWVDQRNSSWNAPYTFSGKEKDAETGYSYFGARYYDSGLSIWLSVDPMSDKYPNMSPYNYCANNPVILVDPDGREIWIIFEIINSDGSKTTSEVQYKKGKLYNKDGTDYSGDNEYANAVLSDLNYLAENDDELNCRINTLETSSNKHSIKMTPTPLSPNGNSAENEDNEKNGIPTGSTTFYNPFNNTSSMREIRPAIIGLTHEFLGHGYDCDQGTTDFKLTKNGIPMFEVNAVNIENRTRALIDIDKKTTYAGKPIPNELLDNTHKK